MTMRNRAEKTRGGEGSVLLGIEEAQRIVLADVAPLPTETVFLLLCEIETKSKIVELLVESANVLAKRFKLFFIECHN